MKESISKFITEGKVLLWIKTNDFQEVERAMIESLNSLENKKFYIYEKGKTKNFLNDSIESGMDNLFNTLDELYPQGIRKIPVFLLIKGGIDEILMKNNLDYFREIVDTKKEAPRYNFTVVIADNENVPPQLEDMADFVDKQITNNEVAIKKYILDFVKFEKLELDENNIEKIIKELKGTIKKYSRKKASNVESKFENMVFVQGGKYQPSFADEEKEVFDIEVCKYPTTQKMWIEVMESNPSKFKGDDKPVEGVTWWQTLEFCNKLSEKYGLEPVYDLSNPYGLIMIKELGGQKVYPYAANFRNTEGFRLPTEVEWEWFARGGQKAMDEGTFDYTYSGSNNIKEVAWYIKNSGGKEEKQMGTKVLNGGSTQEIGLKKPNQLGLYDCSGNVWEWCYDTTEDIENGQNYTYTDFDTSEHTRRVKGGSWCVKDKHCSVLERGRAFTFNNGLSYVYSFHSEQPVNGVLHGMGFRIVRTV